MKKIFIGVALLVVVVSALAVERAALDHRIRNLAFRFEQMQLKPGKRIPARMLRQAQGIILLERTKAGFLFAFQGGSGIAMVRDPKSGEWGAAGFVKANEASLGLQIGGQQSFIVMLLMNTNVTRQLTQPDFEFGAEASGTAGDSSAGAETLTTTHERSMLVYDDRHGLYGGAAVKGGTLSPDPEANLSYYGRALTMGDILFDRAVNPTASAADLASKLSAPESTLEVEVATALTPITTGAGTNVAVEQLQLLLADLNHQKQTNALKHLNGYLSAMITSQQTADAEMTVTILERIRAGRTAEAIELLEFQLDESVIGLADSLTVKSKPERPAGALQAVQRARGYRGEFPRKSGDANSEARLRRAWALLDLQR